MGEVMGENNQRFGSEYVTELSPSYFHSDWNLSLKNLFLFAKDMTLIKYFMKYLFQDAAFWDIVSCSVVETVRRFRRASYLHCQGHKVVNTS
jgi:hypothetical protein